ncbi:E3 ubiquitin-protein ligase TRAIP-like [Sitodiplosis mosellana]|uniref:E3 ubiquitin-protein ligase TRAIP-like n=1 Tax=Sitodiplosis mosellana TaxID=263140 RepID=UPI00244393BA|nr:E3 ubiquitin-protein ligase TRAIP-like [Sitodiplosis mosellana]
MEVVCAICCEDYNPSDSILSVHCGHIFHEKCLTVWTKKSPTCPNCQKNCQSTQKVFLDFDKKDCTHCQQYALLIEIKESRIDKLNIELKNEIAKSRLQFDELKRKIANTDKVLAQKDNDLAKCQQTIDVLKSELNAVRTTNDTENVAPKNERTENTDKAALILREKSEEMAKVQK